MSRAETVPLVLDGAGFAVRRSPLPGEAIAVARWLVVEDIGAVLFFRHRRDGIGASEVTIATRDHAGKWRDLDLASGASGYPDIFSQSQEEVSVALLGTTETLISEADFRGGIPMRIRLLELSVGSSITSIVCQTELSRTEQEISPLGICLAGVLGEGDATLLVYAGERMVSRIPVIV